MPRLVYSEYSGLNFPDNSWSARAYRMLRALWIITVAGAIGGIGGGGVAFTLLHLTGGLPRQEVAGAAGKQPVTVALPAARPPRIAAASTATAPPAALSAAAPSATAPPAALSVAPPTATALQHAAAPAVPAAPAPSVSADQQPRIAVANKPAATEPVDGSLDAASAAAAMPDHASGRLRALARLRRHATRTNQPDRGALAENARSRPRPLSHYERLYDRYDRAYDEAKRSRYRQKWASDNWGGGSYWRPGGWGGGGYWRPGGWGGGDWGE